MTANHEMAHQMGYASESEFYWLSGFCKNDNLHQYSGYRLFLRYCLSNWQSQRRGYFKQLLKNSSRNFKNYKESEQFWKQYDTIIDKGFHFYS
jgi:hypothetical protein